MSGTSICPSQNAYHYHVHDSEDVEALLDDQLERAEYMTDDDDDSDHEVATCDEKVVVVKNPYETNDTESPWSLSTNLYVNEPCVLGPHNLGPTSIAKDAWACGYDAYFDLFFFSLVKDIVICMNEKARRFGVAPFKAFEVRNLVYF